ncbi:hypothetical protein PCANC_18930 [Puccinia coronata f. sp. avenae]|uniref:Galactose oxidase-like Early set domain-containing protein n=1 Tax=Puccinia coronata f. sp. avenae TaxID=200324 RepID=A0A2N5U388_9BASI|nr:hypothetical protein PCANC_18930 [Puccinia coronata f. sp. avenae]PLW33321.1 hypothetical protein PCASD_15537 [Puccinia coronata f. sp. avenae]
MPLHPLLPTVLLALSLAHLIAPQTLRTGKTPNTFEIVGHSGASAQMMFLGMPTKTYVIDKVENNELKLDGLPVWGTSYDTETNVATPMPINSNTFCAGGNVLGNGTWLNVGGNLGVSYGGLNIANNIDPYKNKDGGKSMRLLNPCNDNSCQWVESTPMTTRRWYPTLETLEDGTIIIIGGDDWGGYVNDKGQNNPTYEFFPSKGNVTTLNLLAISLPANLYPLTWLLPSGNLFINSNWNNAIFDYKTNTEFGLPNVPHSVRTYPGSAANAMLPLTPANNWTATLIFCGGTNLQPDQWKLDWNIAAYPTDATCVRITPDVDTNWHDDDSLPEGRSMGNFIFLPDGRLFLLNGIAKGTAGYGNTSWAIGQSFGDGPLYEPAYFDPNAPQGSRWSRPSDLKPSTVARMYHSVALLLPDGSIQSSGSNPNADYVPPGTPGYPYFTEYKVERFYPDYYNKPRPNPTGIPPSISYGGNPFDLKLPKQDISASDALEQTKVVIIRPGFSTHAINMGQRYVQLRSTYDVNPDGSATLHVSQLPPNPAILAPGPAFVYVVVKGVPSIGVMVMVGNGQLGPQPTANSPALPGKIPTIVQKTETAAEMGSVAGGKITAKKSASPRSVSISFSNAVILVGLATVVNWLC